MDTGAPVQRPDDIPDPEAEIEPRTMIVLTRVLDSDAPIREAVETLAVRLRHVHEKYSGQTPQTKRTAAGLSLRAVIDFIDATLPDGQQMRAALSNLKHALTDVEHGRSVAWLANPPGHRPKGAPLLIGTLRGYCAGFVEILHRQGRPVRDAARDVFRKMDPNSPLFVGVSNPSWKTVEGWREKCTGAAEPSAEKDGYDTMLALAERRPDIENRMKEVLKILRKGGAFADVLRAM